MQIILWVTFFFFFFAKQQRITRTGGFFFFFFFFSFYWLYPHRIFCCWAEIVLKSWISEVSNIVSYTYDRISRILHHQYHPLSLSLSLSLPLSQLISCWMNTAMFVSPTSASPATSQRRNPTPACKSLLNSLLSLSLSLGELGSFQYC